MAKKKLSNEELLAIIERIIAKSDDMSDSKMRRERELVQRYYRGEEPKPINKGDSKYVSRDVYDTIDSTRATIAETFLAHQNILQFRPEYGETAEEAKQATEYTRHVFYKVNDGESLIYDALTDGLMNRVAVAKVTYREEKDENVYEFDSLTESELETVVEAYDEPEFEDVTKDETGQLYSGKLKEAKVKKRCHVELLAPEDFKVIGYCADIQKSKACIHTAWKTKSELLSLGFDPKKVNKLQFEDESRSTFDYEKEQRFEQVQSSYYGDDSFQEATRGITLYEIYAELDIYKTGVTKLWKISYAGKTILDMEQVSRRPFAAFIPLPIPHTFTGDNFGASIIPIQNARTILFRQIINHSLITNNPRLQVLNGAVPNPQELLDNRLAGIVNVRRMDAIAPMPQAPLNPYVFNLIQLLDEDKEETTGISKLSQGLNKDAISSQNAQGMIEQLISQSQIRQKIIARRFGLFMRQLWSLIYHTAVDHIEEDEYVSITGDYVPVNPNRWKERKGATLHLALGYGELEAQATKWIEIDQYFTTTAGPQYGPKQRYEVLTRALENRGIEDIKSILLPPDEVPEQEPSELEKLQMEQMRSQIEYQNAQAYAMKKKADTDFFNAETKRMEAINDKINDDKRHMLSMKEMKQDYELAQQELEAAKETSDTRGILSPN
mgnify:CR=1 FL=1